MSGGLCLCRDQPAECVCIRTAAHVTMLQRTPKGAISSATVWLMAAMAAFEVQ